MNVNIQKYKKKNGVALVFVMAALVVVFIMITIAATMTQANSKQAGSQDQGLRAFYVARSGVELAYQALMKKGLIAQFEAGTLTSLPAENDIDFDEGTADVQVTPFVEDELKKIRITSVGTLNGTNVSRTVTLEFFANYKDYPDMKWSY